MDDLLDAFDHPYSSRLSPAFAAAHLLVAGCDGPALRELAGLSERQFEAALELPPAATEEAASLLGPARQRRLALDDGADTWPTAVVVVYASDLVADRVDALAAFVEQRAAAVHRAGAGEVDGLADEDEEQVVLCYGPDPARLRSVLEPLLVSSPVPPLRVEVRTGGPVPD